MDEMIQSIDPSWIVRLVVVGRKTSQVRADYQARRTELQVFSPRGVIVHVGHNDIVPHPRHNPQPMCSSLAFSQAMSFMNEIAVDMPQARIICSSIFPRSVGPRMDRGEKILYNNEALVYGEMVASTCLSQHRRFVLNQCLWESPVDGFERPSLYMRDGLHLNWWGKREVASYWMSELVV